MTQHNDNNKNLLVIKASAGSGKTYNLALQYIKHLLFTQGEDGRLKPRRGLGDSRIVNAHRILLAITFTNKATDEMKKRIVKELYNLAQDGEESDYLEGFVKESGLDEQQVRQLARMALNELLFDYSNFNVSTIDSFFQSILRNFARELDRDFNYDIQLDEKYAVRVALHNFLLSLGKEVKASQVDIWVKEYMRHMTHGNAEKRKWKFFDDGGDLLSFAAHINTEMFRARMGEIRDYLGHKDDQGKFHSDFSRIGAFKQLIHKLVKDCEQEIQVTIEALRQELQPLQAGLYGGRSFSTFMAGGGTDPLKKDSWKIIDESKVSNQFKKTAMPDEAGLANLTRLVREHFAARDTMDFFMSIEKNLGLLGMLAMIDVYLERFRQESNSILIGDTNELIGTVLDSGSDFIYERVGSTIAHFMIDEFQDTSTKQYENFRGLLKESLANGNFNMLIGDAKQSIYRFRNADPTVFRERVGEDFVRDIYQPPVEPGKPKSNNFRSSPNIIEFNNQLFSYVGDCYASMPAVAKSYEDVRQGMPANINEKKVPGYVRMFLGNYKALLDDGAIKQVIQQENITVDETAEVSALTVLPAYLLQLHERFDWGRMGILVNTNAHGRQIVERILEYNRNTSGETINIISGESLLLNNSSVVRRIIALLRFIDISNFCADEDNADDMDGTETVEPDVIARRITRKRQSDQRLYAGLSRFIQAVSAHPGNSPTDNGMSLVQCLDEYNEADADNPLQQSVAAILEQLLPSGDELSTLVSIVENIISYFKSGQVGQGDVDRETAFLLAFQDTVMQFAAMRNGGSVREFLKFWDEKKDKLTVSTSATRDAINIMTIHNAKGLEFECVIIPFANWELNDNSKEKDYWMPGEVFQNVMGTLAPAAPACDGKIVPPLLCVPKKRLVDALAEGRLGGVAKQFVEDQQSAVVIDNLNKTYVAMTRPCTELHLFADDGKNNDLKPLLQDFVENNPTMAPVSGVGGPIADWYEYGEISSRELIDSKRDEKPPTTIQLPMDQYAVNGIPQDIQVRVDRASSSHIDAGLRLHSVLSGIGNRDDLERVVAQAVKHGTISSDPDDPCSIENINAHACRYIMDPGCRVAAWFDPANRVYSERTITSRMSEEKKKKLEEAGKPVVDDIDNLRPDRIIRRPDGSMLVIDYKSGQRRDKTYCRQVQQYIGKLRLIFPGVPIAGRIWYVTHDLILDEQGHQLPMAL